VEFLGDTLYVSKTTLFATHFASRLTFCLGCHNFVRATLKSNGNAELTEIYCMTGKSVVV
jgi:hypothetical protein